MKYESFPHLPIHSSSFSNDLGRLAGYSRREYDIRSSSGRPILLHPLPPLRGLLR